MGRGVGFRSLEGLHEQGAADISRGGTLRSSETEVGSNCEAAPYEEGEDSPPPYAEVAGPGAVIQFIQGVGGETFV